MPADATAPAGQIAISARAMTKVVGAIAADELRVAPRDVAVRLSDDRGLLAVDVAAPVRLPSLGPASSGIIGLCQTARAGIRSRTAELTGRTVRSVAVRVTRAQLTEEARVS